MTDKTMPITGGCLCGAVRYEATEPPQMTGYCHCRMCQKGTGGLFFPFAIFSSDVFRITRGEPKFHKSSERIERGFCGTCGSQVFSRYIRVSDDVIASIGSLDHPEDWRADVHIGVESQIPWLTFHDGLPRTRTDTSHPSFDDAKAASEAG